MSASKLCIMFLKGGKYIWRNYQKTLKNWVLYTYACIFTKGLKLHPKALFHKTKTAAPIFSDPRELGHLILLACLIIGLYHSIKPGLKKIGISELEVFPC